MSFGENYRSGRLIEESTYNKFDSLKRYVNNNLSIKMGYSDQQLREAVDAVFGQFDKDNSNSLDSNEVYNLICAAAQKMGGQQPSQQQVQKFV